MSNTEQAEVIRTFAEAEAVLASTLPGYESRPNQQAFARKVEGSLASATHLIAEAGCGVGKSVGYLVPAILSGKRVVVTTATKALQDQIAGKDLPFLEANIPVPFTWAVLKGRSNYLCRTLLADADNPGAREVKAYIATEVPFDGQRDSLPFEVADRDWREMVLQADDPHSEEECRLPNCYIFEAKARAKEADVVVVNHALFFTDLKVKAATEGKASMLDEYDVVIADEAHELEEWAAKMLGTKFTEASITSLVTEVRNFASASFEAGDFAVQTVLDLADDVTYAASQLWPLLEAGRIVPATLKENEDLWVTLANGLQDFAEAVVGLNLDALTVENVDKAVRRKRLLTARSINLARNFADLIIGSFAKLVRWVEEETWKGQTRKVIQAAPVEVGDILARLVWNDTPAILVSATMSVAGTFDYIAGRLGIVTYDSVDVGTPFDYRSQAGLYVPEHLPAPDKDGRVAWESMSIFEMGELVKASDGRALLLFTSTKQMKAAYAVLSTSLPYTTLMQGQAPNKVLAAQFMEDTHSVLFALRSFFTGMDFQGEACSLVVIDKLPFPVPSEPLTAARCEAIVNRGGNDFSGYTIPVMSLILKQGFGRLIRHRNDRGIVAILDSRLTHKGYGRTILASLPDATRMTRLDQVQGFYGEAA